MTGSLDRRSFLRTAAAAGAALGLVAAAARRPVGRRREAKPLFKISLAEWSLHRALPPARWTTSISPTSPSKTSASTASSTSTLLQGQGQGHRLPDRAEEALRRPRREERPDHVRRRRRSRRSRRRQADQGRREPLQVGRGRQVPRLPFDPRERPLDRRRREEQHEARRRRPAPAQRVRRQARHQRDRRKPRRALVQRRMAGRRDQSGRPAELRHAARLRQLPRSATTRATTATRASPN